MALNRFLMTLIGAFALSSCTAPDALNIHTASYHTERRPDPVKCRPDGVHCAEKPSRWTEVNPGLGVEWSDRWFGGAGVFENSYGNLSAYMAGGYRWDFGPVEAGPVAGLALYDEWQPVAGLTAIFGESRVRPSIAWFPTLEGDSVFTFSLRVDW